MCLHTSERFTNEVALIFCPRTCSVSSHLLRWNMNWNTRCIFVSKARTQFPEMCLWKIPPIKRNLSTMLPYTLLLVKLNRNSFPEHATPACKHSQVVTQQQQHSFARTTTALTTCKEHRSKDRESWSNRTNVTNRQSTKQQKQWLPRWQQSHTQWEIRTTQPICLPIERFVVTLSKKKKKKI